MGEASRRSAIVLATGMEEKTISRHFAPDESGTLLEYVLDSVWTVADELIIVFGKEPSLALVEALSPFGAKIMNSGGNQSLLNVLNVAAKTSSSENFLLATEQVPLLKPNVALALFEGAQGYDLAIPKWKNGRIEPLLSVFRRKAFVRASMVTTKPQTGEIRSDLLTSVIDQLFDVNYISVDSELKYLDPELDSFLFVKDEKSLQDARQKASITGKRIPRQET